MKATFRWRKTVATYTLLGWDNVLMRDELPFEYVNGPGPKFWYVPPVVAGKVAYNEHIRLGTLSEDHSGYVRIMIGSVLFVDDHDKLIAYLKYAAERLHILNEAIAESKEITDEV